MVVEKKPEDAKKADGKQDGKKKGAKDDAPVVEELTEEEQQLKNNLDTCVERLGDADPGAICSDPRPCCCEMDRCVGYTALRWD
jgi:hypothetical protein